MRLPTWHSGKESAFQYRRHKRQVQSFGWEDPLEKEMAPHFSILAWKIPWAEEPGSPWGHKESDTTEQLSTHTHPVLNN